MLLFNPGCIGFIIVVMATVFATNLLFNIAVVVAVVDVACVVVVVACVPAVICCGFVNIVVITNAIVANMSLLLLLLLLLLQLNMFIVLLLMVMVGENQSDSGVVQLPAFEGQIVITGGHYHPKEIHHDQKSSQQDQTEARPEPVVVVVRGRSLDTQEGACESERCEHKETG